MVTATVTIAADGEIVRKDFVLPTGTGKVTGTVIDQGSNNQPVAATVTLSAQVPGPTGAPQMQPFANIVSGKKIRLAAASNPGSSGCAPG